MRRSLAVACALCGATVLPAGLPQGAAAQARASAESVPLVAEWVADAAAGVAESEQLFARGDAAGGRERLLRVYLDRFEGIEAYYGEGGPHSTPELAARVSAAEVTFHALLRPELPAGLAAARAAALGREIQQIARVATASGAAGVRALPLSPAPAGHAAPGGPARTAEIQAVLDELALAGETMATDRAAALGMVERAYLERFEPIESRLPGEMVNRIERAIHLQLRPALVPGGDLGAARATLAQLRTDLSQADTFLASGGSFWFGAANSFTIIVREGLEAVLLIAALLAYLGASGAGARPRRQLYAGLAAGVLASFGTWLLARTLVPISGGHRELAEGVTALAAVAVLLYVSHWLFQKSYVHDWKKYLREHAGQAVARGSALAMAALAFAAVYREGFETVLFYQTLQYDVGARAIVAGFVPGALLIAALGFAIVRFGVALPLRRVFAVTNAVLLYLAFAFLGKGLYNLQEAGLFSPAPLGWVPDHQVLRQLLGVYPVAQTLLAQAAFLLLVALTYGLHRARQRAGRPALSEAAGPATARPA